MENNNLFIISIYVYFTICNGFSQVNASEFQNNKLDLNENAIIIENDNQDDDPLYERIKFTPEGLKHFFNHKFNDQRYIKNLPHNLIDILDFLEYAKATNQNKRFIRTTLKIFNQKFKSLAYLSAKHFTELIARLPELIDYSFYGIENDEHTTVKNILFNEFKYKYSFFQEDPRKFVNHLSDQICRAVNIKNICLDDISADELRATILRFLETGLMKIVWFIEDETDIWTQFKETCQKIYKLKEKNILYELEDINDLILTAIDKFLFILDARGSELSIEFYEKIWTEIHENSFDWLNLEELEELLETKKNKLLKGLKKIHLKTVARFRYGLISNT